MLSDPAALREGCQRPTKSTQLTCGALRSSERELLSLFSNTSYEGCPSSKDARSALEGCRESSSALLSHGDRPRLAVTRPVAVPTLAQIMEDRTLLDALPSDVLIGLRRECDHLYADLDAEIARQQQARWMGTTEPERVVLIDEAARMLATSEDTLYSKWRKLPFAFKDPLDGKIKFRVTGLDRYIAGRRASNAS